MYFITDVPINIPKLRVTRKKTSNMTSNHINEFELPR